MAIAGPRARSSILTLLDVRQATMPYTPQFREPAHFLPLKPFHRDPDDLSSTLIPAAMTPSHIVQNLSSGYAFPEWTVWCFKPTPPPSKALRRSNSGTIRLPPPPPKRTPIPEGIYSTDNNLFIPISWRDYRTATRPRPLPAPTLPPPPPFRPHNECVRSTAPAAPPPHPRLDPTLPPSPSSRPPNECIRPPDPAANLSSLAPPPPLQPPPSPSGAPCRASPAKRPRLPQLDNVAPASPELPCPAPPLPTLPAKRKPPPTFWQFCSRCWIRGEHHSEECTICPHPFTPLPKPIGFNNETTKMRNCPRAQKLRKQLASSAPPPEHP
jgi:hypothetical protein